MHSLSLQHFSISHHHHNHQNSLLKEDVHLLLFVNKNWVLTKLKSRSNSSKRFRSGASMYEEDEGLRLGYYYQ